MAVLGLVFVVAAVHNPSHWGARAYGVLIALVALVGASIAARHVWLQYFTPEHVGACLPGLDYLLASFPLIEVTWLILYESGDCSGIDWNFLNLSIPVWSLIAFFGLGIIGAVRGWMPD
jgi:disulfide bond formation protein DsbB